MACKCLLPMAYRVAFRRIFACLLFIVPLRLVALPRSLVAMSLCLAGAWTHTAQAQIRLVDSTVASGLNFHHEDGADRQGYLPSLMASGLASFDYDNDGRIDVFFLNGHNLPQKIAVDSKPHAAGHQLFRNLGQARFANVAASSGSDRASFGLGVAAADFDNDGFVDIAISNLGSISLLQGQGDGTFCDVTETAGLSQAPIAFGAGIAFLDIENDGDLDLYVADYVDFSFEDFDSLSARTYPYPPGPDHFEARADHLFRNNGDGSFEDHSLAAGIAQFKAASMGIVCGDFDHDQDTDIFVCCDAQPNLAFINDGHGVFSQDAELLGVAYNALGIPVGSMGAEAGDVDNDGWEDLFVTDYAAQMPILFRSIGQFGFEDRSISSRSGKDVIPHANWGAGLVDFDNDGDRDLMIGNGHLFKWAHQVEQLTDFKVPNCLLENDGSGRFRNVTSHAGSGLAITESTRGMAFDDLDNDGDIDVVELNSDAPASYLENQTETSHHWVAVQLCGDRFNRSGVGARVSVECGNRIQVAEVRSGRAYQSSYGTSCLHFGLQDCNTIDRITVDWLGTTSVYEHLAVDRCHLLRQGDSP